jgi:hypothetical protein
LSIELIDKLKSLKEKRAAGDLSQEEYASQRDAILAKLSEKVIDQWGKEDALATINGASK